MSTIEDDIKKIRPRAAKVSRYGLYRDVWPLMYAFIWWDADNVQHTWCAECEKVTEGLPDGETGIRWKIVTELNPNYDSELPEDIYSNPKRIPIEIIKPPVQSPIAIQRHKLYYAGTPPKLTYIPSLGSEETGLPVTCPVYEYENKQWILRGYMDGGTVNQILSFEEFTETSMSHDKILPHFGTSGFGPANGPYDSPVTQLTPWFPTFDITYLNGVPYGTQAITASIAYAGNNTTISNFKGSGYAIGLWAGRVDGYSSSKVTGYTYYGSPPYWDAINMKVEIPEDCYIFDIFTYPKIGGGALVAAVVPSPYDPYSSTKRYIDGHNWGAGSDSNYHPPAHLLWLRYGFSRLRSMVLEGANAIGWVSTAPSGHWWPFREDRAWSGCYGLVYLGTYPVITSNVTGGKAVEGARPSAESIVQITSFHDEAWMGSDWAGFTRNWFMTEFGDDGSQAKWTVHPTTYGGKTVDDVTRVLGYASTIKTEYGPGGTDYFGNPRFPQRTSSVIVSPIVNTDPSNPAAPWPAADPDDFPGIDFPLSTYSKYEIAGVNPSTNKITFVDRGFRMLGFAVPGGYFRWSNYHSGSPGSATVTSYKPLDERTIVINATERYPYKVTAMTLDWTGLDGEPPAWEFDVEGCRIENFCDIRLAETNALPTVIGYGLPRVTFTYSYEIDYGALIDYIRVWAPTPEDIVRGGMYAQDTAFIGLLPCRLPWPWVGAEFDSSLEVRTLSVAEGRDPDFGTLAPVLPTQPLEFVHQMPHRFIYAERSVPYSAAVVVTGGRGPFTYAISSGSLPLGLTLDMANGVITGTPEANVELKDYTFVVEVTDKTLPTSQVISGQFVIAVIIPTP